MPRLDPAQRTAWVGTVVVVLVAAVAVAWPVLSFAALGVDVLLCVLVVRLTSARLHLLRRQARLHEHESLHDPVTELPNRTLFHQRATGALTSRRAHDHSVAIMLLDLDRFKEINDTLGHHQGDLLLHQVGARLRDAVRAGDVVARLGGDEFAVLAVSLNSPDEAFLLAERLREAVSVSVELEGVAVEVEASIGLALAADGEHDSERLLCGADVAMYEAKRRHTGIELYDPAADDSSRTRLSLLADLRDAVVSDELLLHYQPKADTRTGRVSGVEALVRWQHPRLGLLYPDQFLGLAENTGLMRPLTSRVLDLALGQCREWRDAGHPDLTVAVNISTRNLLDGAFPGEVGERLVERGLPGSALELEITETTLMVDPVRARAVLSELAALGVGLAIDDFGTGYTSLSWLSELPVSTLKIDRSFVMRMGERTQDAAIVRSSVQLANNLDLRVVAEGVEDSRAWGALAELGCDCIQGYHLSRPLAPAAFEDWIRAYRPGDASPSSGAVMAAPAAA